MQMIDYESLTWFLLQHDGILFLDIPLIQSADVA